MRHRNSTRLTRNDLAVAHHRRLDAPPHRLYLGTGPDPTRYNLLTSSPGGPVMLVHSRMTSDVLTASPDTTLAEALSITREHRVRHLPIVEDGHLVGLVTERDLRLALPPAWAAEHDELMEALHHRHVREVMTTAIIAVQPDTPIEDAARLLYTHRVGCLPVLDLDRLVGIITETDLLRALTEVFGAQTSSTRVEVQMPNRPGELARVVRLVGIENRVNIAGMVVPPLRGGDESVAIMQLQTLDPEQIIYALRKCGYRVGSPSLETDPDVDIVPTEDYTPRTSAPPFTRRALAEL
jgi:acetoin utilization protein AcuB